jgi:hypothetical protein
MYRVEENKLIIGDSEITFDFPIQDFIEIGNMLIVYLDFYDKVIPLEENVFGVELSEKKIKWQIEKRKYPSRGYSQMKCPFTGISFRENVLRLHNWCSVNLIVDPLTGDVLAEEETR